MTHTLNYDSVILRHSLFFVQKKKTSSKIGNYVIKELVW